MAIFLVIPELIDKTLWVLREPYFVGPPFGQFNFLL